MDVRVVASDKEHVRRSFRVRFLKENAAEMIRCALRCSDSQKPVQGTLRAL